MGSYDHAHYAYRTPHGPITIAVHQDAICAIALGDVNLGGMRRPTELSNECANQLLEYFAGKRTSFDLPIAPDGTPFQKTVWEALQNIPYGETRTTSEIAEVLGHPDSYRMVGLAIRKNPVIILIPGHRIVGANGKPTGNDRAAKRRAAFLELERRNASFA